MAAVAYENVLEMAHQLKPEEQKALITALQTPPSTQINREMVLAEFNRRKKAGLFQKAEDLYGKYAHPIVNITEEELSAAIHEAATEWEQELDEFASDNN